MKQEYGFRIYLSNSLTSVSSVQIMGNVTDGVWRHGIIDHPPRWCQCFTRTVTHTLTRVRKQSVIVLVLNTRRHKLFFGRACRAMPVIIDAIKLYHVESLGVSGVFLMPTFAGGTMYDSSIHWRSAFREDSGISLVNGWWKGWIIMKWCR